jgi:hypothetical protein
MAEMNAGESTCPICNRHWLVTPNDDCLLPACGCFGGDTSAANPARPCEACGLKHMAKHDPVFALTEEKPRHVAEITLADQIKAVESVIKMRRAHHPRAHALMSHLIGAAQLEEAKNRIEGENAAMEAALATLRTLERGEKGECDGRKF